MQDRESVTRRGTRRRGREGRGRVRRRREGDGERDGGGVVCDCHFDCLRSFGLVPFDYGECRATKLYTGRGD